MAETRPDPVFHRRRFVGAAAAAAVGWPLATPLDALPADTGEKPSPSETPVPNAPIGTARGIHPGRVTWLHQPQAAKWEGPGKGHWWEDRHTDQAVVDRMLARAVCRLAGEDQHAAAWDRIFRHFNLARRKADAGYRPGQKIAIKVNFVGFIWRWETVDPETYAIKGRKDYMNTSPQAIRAVLRQLVKVVGVSQTDITVGDTLARFPNEYYELLHGEFPKVRYLEHEGRFGRVAARPSSAAVHWSCRPEGCLPDYAPDCFTEADYLVNLANLKSHTATGVTLCAKNHYGSLVRWPAEKGYYDLHPSGFGPAMGKYRNLVDLMGHAHFGGKTLLYLIDGLYAGRHPIDNAPKKWSSPPFDGHWTSSLFASLDPVAIDSVGLDFLRAEWHDYPHKSGTEDYLHEAALAADPPSGTFYDPNHSGEAQRLASLGVHEHWNNPRQKRYSRNLGTGAGIELV